MFPSQEGCTGQDGFLVRERGDRNAPVKQPPSQVFERLMGFPEGYTKRGLIGTYFGKEKESQ